METPNSNNICGCRPEKLANRSTEENLQECYVCGILKSCPYPKLVADEMVKCVSEEPTQNIQDSAKQSVTFSDFREKTSEKQDKLQRQPQNKGKSIKQLSRESLYFDEFREKERQIEDEIK